MRISRTAARPRQVTTAGWAAGVGSVLLLLTLFEAMGQLRSVEVRDALEQFLSSPPGDGTGITVAGAVSLLRVLLMFTGAVAAAALVLAVYVLRRHNAARIGLTLSAVTLMLTAPLSGGFLPVLLGFSVLLLWTKPAREWFSGAAAVRADGLVASSASSPAGDPTAGDPTAGDPVAGDDRPGPPPTVGYGTPQQGWPPPGSGYPAGPYGGYPPPVPAKRPVAVVVAAWLTWAFAGVTLLVLALLALMLSVGQQAMLDAIRQEPQLAGLNVPDAQLVGGLWVLTAVVGFWCLASMVLAFLAYRGANWARILLAVSAGLAALVSLPALPLGLLHLLAAVATVVLLFVGGANRWYAGTPGVPRGYASYGPGAAGYGGAPPGYYGGEPPNSGQDPPKNLW